MKKWNNCKEKFTINYHLNKQLTSQRGINYRDTINGIKLQQNVLKDKIHNYILTINTEHTEASLSFSYLYCHQSWVL